MSAMASVLHLDRLAVKALRITDPYSLHRVVYSLYPDVRSDADKTASQSSGILYADQGGDHRGRKVLMLSNRPPAEQVDGHYGQVLSKPIPDGFLDHDHYRFKTIVNPTRRNKATGKLVAVRGRHDIAQWFVERARNSWGFEVDPESLQVDRVEVLDFYDKEKRQVTIGQAHIHGVLTVSDRDQFKHSFLSGIGRARAYGCGLLQIEPFISNPFS